MIGMESVVRLAPKARLRFDRHAQKYMILYPERGLVLSPTASDIVTSCVEAKRVSAIVDSLVDKYGAAQRDAIARDVVEVLQGLADRGLVTEVPA
jgi:coenzyme PQQ biosynthesis protein PqqD